MVSLWTVDVSLCLVRQLAQPSWSVVGDVVAVVLDVLGVVVRLLVLRVLDLLLFRRRLVRLLLQVVRVVLDDVRDVVDVVGPASERPDDPERRRPGTEREPGEPA